MRIPAKLILCPYPCNDDAQYSKAGGNVPSSSLLLTRSLCALKRRVVGRETILFCYVGQQEGLGFSVYFRHVRRQHGSLRQDAIIASSRKKRGVTAKQPNICSVQGLQGAYRRLSIAHETLRHVVSDRANSFSIAAICSTINTTQMIRMILVFIPA